MDRNSFDALSRALTSIPSRRDVLRSLATGMGLWLVIARPPAIGEASKQRKRKKRKQKVKPNAYGCLEVGQPCKASEQCCSGICEGKKGKLKCRAHGIGTCEQDEPGLCEAGNPFAVLCDGGNGLCIRTTAGSNYCGQLLSPTACAACRKDADCEAQGFPAGTACAPFGGEFVCGDQCQETGTACIVPAGTPLPEG